MAINLNYIFNINVVYVKTNDDNIEITNDTVLNRKWSKGYTSFKNNIRIQLKLEQQGRCAFCRCRVSVGTSWSNLEHMVSKTDYPQFKFLPNNLVYCCTKCNMAKVKKNTLVTPNVARNLQIFPNNSTGFTIINPYYDNYEDHIDFIDDIIIQVANKSTKGKETIDIYKLFRPDLAEERAFELQLQQKSINQQLIIRLTDSTLNQEVIDQITSVIALMPTWTI